MGLPVPILDNPRPLPRGTLNDVLINYLIDHGCVRAAEPFDDNQVQPSSLDLRIGDIAYDIGFSSLPGDDGVAYKLMRASTKRIDLRKGCTLRPGATYLLPLQESLRLPLQISGVANAKSSTGRIDLLARLLTEEGISFDCVPAGYKGPLYLEVCARSFPVTLTPGLKLSQLRFRMDAGTDGIHLTDRELDTVHGSTPLVDTDIHLANGLILSADMKGEGAEGVIAYEAVPNKRALSPSLVKGHRTTDFWKTIRLGRDPLIIHPGRFYILATKEYIQVPPGLAAEVVSVDPRFGSHQSHIAGFLDSGFGFTTGSSPGSRLVLEVRTWDVPFQIRHGQPICCVKFERMIRPPEKLYGGGTSNYARQTGAKLSKIFF